WLFLLWLFGIAWVIVALCIDDMPDNWSIANFLVFFVVAFTLPIKLIFHDKFPWGRHWSSPLAYTLRIDPNVVIAERGDDRRLVWARGNPIIWNSVARTLAVEGSYPEVFARLRTEDFVPIVLERGWTVIIDGVAYSLPTAEGSSYNGSSSPSFH
ncbi:MAG: hypothetical protein ACRCWS_02640, partial [Propionibacteriaceae bacterium]